jgi:hypothetical protein
MTTIKIEPAGVKFREDKNMASLTVAMPAERNGDAHNVDT